MCFVVLMVFSFVVCRGWQLSHPSNAFQEVERIDLRCATAQRVDEDPTAFIVPNDVIRAGPKEALRLRLPSVRCARQALE